MQKCLYCDSKQTEDLHFQCEACGAGMCDDCYDNLVDHTAHYHYVLDSICPSQIDVIRKLVKLFGDSGPTYVCETCLSKFYK